MAGVPRQATGYVDPHHWTDGKTISWRLQVRANGQRHTVTLGTNHEGWNEERAQVELDTIMAKVRRGTWTPEIAATAPPPQPSPVNPGGETIRLTLSRWWQRKKTEVEENTRADYEWRLGHILAFRHTTPTAEIDERWVDELRDHLAKQPAKNRREGSDKTLSPTSVNKVLEVLAQALDVAVDHKLIGHNPARGKRRRMRVKKSKKPWLEPDMVLDLLEVAGEWEQAIAQGGRSKHQGAHPEKCYGRRELLALLCLGGPRISEALKADRGEFDLAGGDRWRIPASKTEAGQRDVELTAFLTDELRTHVAASPSRRRDLSPRKPMFPTVNGTRLGQNNVRRMLREAVARTNERREAEDKMLLPAVTPHSLRVTFVALCFMAGRDPAWVMGQVGHKDARLTLEVYARTMQRKRVDRDLVWRLMRFADESEHWPGTGRFGTTNGTTDHISASDPTASIRGE